eukprot:g78909.t1
MFRRWEVLSITARFARESLTHTVGAAAATFGGIRIKHLSTQKPLKETTRKLAKRADFYWRADEVCNFVSCH